MWLWYTDANAKVRSWKIWIRFMWGYVKLALARAMPMNDYFSYLVIFIVITHRPSRSTGKLFPCVGWFFTKEIQPLQLQHVQRSVCSICLCYPTFVLSWSIEGLMSREADHDTNDVILTTALTSCWRRLTLLLFEGLSTPSKCSFFVCNPTKLTMSTIKHFSYFRSRNCEDGAEIGAHQ